MTKRYLITGASGFIGSHLCRHVREQGHRVRALLRHPAEGPWDEAVYGELTAPSLPEDLFAGIEGIFHLAGRAHAQDSSREAERLHRKINVEGTRALLAGARRAGVKRFVYFSSIKAAGDPGERCVDETWDAAPADPYGRSKREAEQRVLETGKESGMHVCNLRPVLVYGRGVQGNLKRMLQSIARGRFPPLPESGNRRSLVSVDDLVCAAWLAMNHPQANGKTYIVCDGHPLSTRQMYEAMCRALGRKVPGWWVPLWMLRAGARLGTKGLG